PGADERRDLRLDGNAYRRGTAGLRSALTPVDEWAKPLSVRYSGIGYRNDGQHDCRPHRQLPRPHGGLPSPPDLGFLPGSDLRGSDLLRLSRRRARRRPTLRAGNRVGDGCSRLGPHLLDTFAHAEDPAPRPELVKRRGQQDAIALRGLESDLAL